MTWKALFIYSYIFVCHLTDLTSSATAELSDSYEESVVGSQAQIPCGIDIDGLVQLIRFTKRGSGTIYTFDVRKGINDAIHRTNYSRMSFSLLQKPLHLEIKDIVATDEGLYECNFFYERKKKYTHSTYLTVIIPPEQIRIFDSSGKEVDQVAGPFKENSTVQINCQVTGGRPPPAVKWWLAGSLLDETIDSRATNVLRNTLTIGPMKRSHLNTKYVCQASNTNFTASISKQIQLDVHYKPLTINITTPESPLVASENYKIQCVSSGGRPPTVITWWLGGKVHIMNASTDYTTDSGNTTLSTLIFAPKDTDGGKKLECRSESPEVEHSALTAHWVLDIHYPPKANVTLSPDREIKEGDSARLECRVTSNPPLTNVTWYHKQRKVEANKWENIQIENTSLIISSAKRQMSGPFTCVASNQVGMGDSNAVVLTVQYAPVCSTEESELVGASHRETVLVHCRLKAQPKISSIRWQFNSSGELIDIAEDQYIVDSGGRMSLLNYTVKSVDDYGSLLCWGKNPLGEQLEPCVFNVIEAALPDKPTNCTQVNQTSSTVFVKCIGGHDGGLPQSFVAEVFDMSRKEIIRNDSYPQPAYPLRNLPSGTDFLVTIYSMNSKGSSEQQLLQVYTNFRADADIFGFQSTHVFPLTPILGVLIGVVSALVLVALIVVVVMKLRSGAADKKPPEEGNKRLGVTSPSERDGGESGEGGPPNDSQTDCCEIPNKLKHANFYETPPTYKPNQNGNHPTEAKSDDSDNLEYAELNFKSKNKKKKKSSKSNGKVHSSKDTTIYASIDHIQTEKQKLINSRKGKERSDGQKQKGQKAEAPSPPPSPPQELLTPPSVVSSTIETQQASSLILQPQQPKLTSSNGNQSKRSADQTQTSQPNPEPQNKSTPLGAKHREIASRKSSGKPTNLDKPAIPKKPAALAAPEVIKQKKKKTVETQTPDSTEGGEGGPEEKGKKIDRNFGTSENIPENLPLMEVTVESNL